MSEISQTVFGTEKTYYKINKCAAATQEDRRLIGGLTSVSALRSLMMETPRPKCYAADEDILLVLRGINLNEGQRADDMVSLRLWLNNEVIIVSKLRPVKLVDDIETRLKDMQRPVDVMIEIVDELFGRIERHIFDIDEKVDEFEDLALTDASANRRQDILDFRRSIIALRRYLLPQRETMMTLSRSSSPLLDDEDRKVITDQYYRSARLCDQLDAVRERLSLIQEEITAMLSDRMNKNMYVLSIISMIFLPLGVLTGLFGINVGGMPGVAESGGVVEPYAFWLVAMGCLLVAGSIYLFMRIKKWI